MGCRTFLHNTLVLLLLLLALSSATAKKDDIIKDVTAKQLDEMIEESDYVAVYWCEYTGCCSYSTPLIFTLSLYCSGHTLSFSLTNAGPLLSNSIKTTHLLTGSNKKFYCQKLGRYVHPGMFFQRCRDIARNVTL